MLCAKHKFMKNASSPPFISVVVPSFNQPATINNCLQSLLNQSTGDNYEIIIVDSSHQEYREEIQKVCSQSQCIKLIQEEKQTFPGTARNIGIKASQGEIVALIDADCEASANWLQNIAKNVTENIIVSGVILNGTPKNVNGTISYLIEFNHFIPFNQTQKVSTVAATCNFAAYKTVFEKVGYFTDHRAFEDILFCKKFIQLGGKVVLFNDVIITHLNRTSLGHVINNQKLLGYHSAAVRKEFGMPPKLIFKFPLLAFLLFPYRFLSILSRLLKSGMLFRFILYSPLIKYVLFYWCSGFYKGAKA